MTDLIKKGRQFGHKDPPEDPKSAFSTFSRTALETTVSTFYQEIHQCEGERSVCVGSRSWIGVAGSRQKR